MARLTRKEKEDLEKMKPDRNELISRVAAAKELLPNSGITGFFINNFPEYDTTKKKARLSNVLQFRLTDEEITKKIELLAKINGQK